MSQNEAPVFIKLEEYNDILTIVTVIKKKIGEAKETLLKLEQLREEEDNEVVLWQNNLKDVNEKIEFVDELLKEPKF